MNEPVRPARDVNPDAGNHRVTTDPAAIAACEAATATPSAPATPVGW
ncbi:hypothetical protein [Mariniluteicoccus flavus]